MNVSIYLQKLIIANRQQYETEKHMLLAAQRDNDNLSRENKVAAKKYNELVEDQEKLEVRGNLLIDYVISNEYA